MHRICLVKIETSKEITLHNYLMAKCYGHYVLGILVRLLLQNTTSYGSHAKYSWGKD